MQKSQSSSPRNINYTKDFRRSRGEDGETRRVENAIKTAMKFHEREKKQESIFPKDFSSGDGNKLEKQVKGKSIHIGTNSEATGSLDLFQVAK